MLEPSTDRQLHLTFLQDAIKRMGQNSFVIKGWCVAIVTAVLAFSAKDGFPVALKAAFLPIAFLWFIDSRFLSLERKYRKLYDRVRSRDPQVEDFSLDVASISGGNVGLLRSLFSFSTLTFYLALAAALEVIAFATSLEPLTVSAKRLLSQFLTILVGS